MIEILYFTVFIVLLNILTGFKKSNVLGCGLVGFSGEGSFKIPLIRTLLWYNSVARKSTDATGIFTPSMGIIKDVKKPQEFFKDESNINSLEENDNILMGHVRAATVGDKTDKSSAHPWDFGDIVMMHNGTLKEASYRDLAVKYELKDEDWKVDSQVLGMAIQKNFQSNEPFKVLSEYTGAAAVIIYHKKRESLFVYRDEERTLSYGYLNDSDMYISSESDILEIIGCTGIKSFDPFKVHEIKDGKILSKMKVKTKKANKNVFVNKVVTSVKSLLKFKQYTTSKFFLKDFYTGFSHKAINSRYMEGYKLEAIANVNGNTENFKTKITKGKFYKVLTPKEDNSFTITDDNNIVSIAFLNFFNISNFIPFAGNYIIYDTTTNYSGISLKYGQLYEVVYHKFGFPEVLVRDHVSGEVVKTDINNVRVASYEEVADYFKNDGKLEVISVYDVENNDTETCSVNNNISIIEDAEVIEEDDSIDIDWEVHKNLLTSLKSVNTKLNKLRQQSTMNKEILDNIVLIEDFVGKCISQDKSFILNINENTLENYAN